MKIFVATVLSIALFLGKSVKLRAFVTGPVASDGDGPASQSCPMCCEGPAATHGIPGFHGQFGPMGPYGQPGSKGDAGQPGQNGEIGPIGPMGERGAPGNAGPKGNDGIGQPGKIGPKGLPGVVGNPGQIGVKGQKGEQGQTPDDSNQRVAFTAVRTRPSDTSADNHIPLSFHVVMQSRASFDIGTGMFTCSVPGTYVFMFSAFSNNLNLHLQKNDDWVVSGGSDNSPYKLQVSGGAVLVLQRGDTVRLTMNDKTYSDSNHHYTSFSGFLLYA